MSDQPKPTTGEAEPYPTQEEREELSRYGEPQPEERQQLWTAVKLRTMYIEAGESMQPIADAHNAALAAERELADIGRKWKADSSLESWFPFTVKEIQQLREQLADVTAAMTEAHQKGFEKGLGRIQHFINGEEAEKAIAAAQQSLVDALKDTNCLLMSIKGEMYEQAMAQVMENNSALAKVKAGK